MAFQVKWTIDEDGYTDSLKFVLVVIYMANFYSIMWQKKELTEGDASFKLRCVMGTVLALQVAISAFTMFLIWQEFREEEFEGQNNDHYTLGLTMLTDFEYLCFYYFVRSKRAGYVTVALIVFEVIVFGFALTLESDNIIDTVNLCVMMVRRVGWLFISSCFTPRRVCFCGPCSYCLACPPFR